MVRVCTPGLTTTVLAVRVGSAAASASPNAARSALLADSTLILGERLATTYCLRRRLGDAEAGQDALAVLELQQGEQDVLGADVVVAEAQGLAEGEFEDLLGVGAVGDELGDLVGGAAAGRRSRPRARRPGRRPAR